jgi:Tfp pilus assembly protein PilF
LKESDKALNDLNRAIELAPQRADWYLARARAFERLNYPDKARDDFTRAIQLEPK